jgi:hypothetical protein
VRGAPRDDRRVSLASLEASGVISTRIAELAEILPSLGKKGHTMTARYGSIENALACFSHKIAPISRVRIAM